MKTTRKTKSTKQNIFQKTTDRFCQIFESGEPIKFNLGWYRIPAANAVSGRIYKGIYNRLFLSFAAQDNGYDLPLWMTYNQAQKLGGNLKGAKGKGVGIAATGTSSKKVVEIDENGEKEEKRKSRWFMKGFTVFNVSEVNDLPQEFLDKLNSIAPTLDFEENAAAEELLKKMPNAPEIKHGGESACYVPATDVVHMPKPERFRSSAEYYSALFHEVVHSTLHESRLNRPHGCKGTAAYDKEELIAVLGSAMAADMAGVEFDFEGWADYMRGYCPALRENPNLLFQVSSAAEKAVKYIFGEIEDAGNAERDEAAA